MPTHRSARRFIVALLLPTPLLVVHPTPASAQEAAFAPGVQSRFFPISVISTQATPRPTGLVPLLVDPGEGDGPPHVGGVLIGGALGSVVGLYGGLIAAFSGGGYVGFALTAGLGTAAGTAMGGGSFFPAFLASSLMAVPTLRMAGGVSDGETGFWLTYAAAQGLVGAIASQFRRN